MSIDRETINRILELNLSPKDYIFEGSDGQEYWISNHQQVVLTRPPIRPVSEVSSLLALLSAFEAPELKNATCETVQVVVKSPTEVSVVSRPYETRPDKDQQLRDCYITAKWPGSVFQFGRYMDVEEFIISAQCGFDESESKASLIAFVSKICKENSVETSDDGLSQTVTVKDGLRKAVKEFNPILTLKVRCTFPEVCQPYIQVLVRVSGDKSPMVALFRADGDMWKTEASTLVAEYLRNSSRIKERGIAVIG